MEDLIIFVAVFLSGFTLFFLLLETYGFTSKENPKRSYKQFQKRHQYNELNITMVGLDVMCDYSIKVNRFSRSAEVPNKEMAEGFVRGYMEGMNDQFAKFFEEIEINEKTFRVVTGSALMLFYLHESEHIDFNKPYFIFRDDQDATEVLEKGYDDSDFGARITIKDVTDAVNLWSPKDLPL